MDAEKVLFALLRAAVCGAAVEDEIKTACTPEMLEQVYALADRHDLAHLVGQAASKLDLPESEALAKCKQAAMQAFMRYMQLNHAYEQACKTLDEAKIPFIPLKGSVLRSYYPEPWMRTSCDIDILVSIDNLDVAADLLVEKLDYVRKQQSDHDISMFAPSGIHMELHYLAVAEGQLPEAQAVLGNIWSDAVTKAAGSNHYCMSDAMFYFYHIAHMAKHFENGGCGIRPLLDIWILNHCVDHDREARERLLSQGGMLTFHRAAEKLSEVWFSDLEKDPLSGQLERFILDGGVYGTLKGRVTVGQSERKGKLRYAFSKIFLPYSTIKHHYPILKKHRWLTPVCEVLRWLRLIFKGEMKRVLHELKINAEITPEEISSTDALLRYLGL